MTDQSLPPVSVIVPAFNVEAFLPAAVESFEDLAYPCCNLVIVNDGSTDATLEVARRLAAQDRRIAVIDQPNGGVSSARNTGIAAATGDYVMFLDADDRLTPEGMGAMVRVAQHAGADMVVAPLLVYEDLSKDPIRQRMVDVQGETLVEGSPLRVNECFHVGCRLLSRSLAQKVRFSEAVTLCEDRLFVYQAYEQACVVASCQTPAYRYWNSRAESAMHSLSLDDRFTQFAAETYLMQRELEKGRIYPSQANYYAEMCFGLLRRTANRPQTFNAVLQEAKPFASYVGGYGGMRGRILQGCFRSPVVGRLLMCGMGVL